MAAETNEPGVGGQERFARRVVIAVAIGIAGIALALFLWYAMYVLLLAFAGVLVAVALRSMALAVARWTGLRVGRALALVIALIVIGFGGAGRLLAPSVARQVDDFTERLPTAVSALETQLANYRWGRQLLGRTTPPPPVESDAENDSAAAASTRPVETPGDPPATRPANPVKALSDAVQPASLVRLVVKYASLLVQAVVSVLVVLVVGIYLAADPHHYERGVLRLLPHAYRPRVSGVLCEVSEVLQMWMTAQLIPMAVIGAVTALGLWLLGVRLWLTLGLLAALFNFVPNFGPLVSFVPAVLLALAESPAKGLGVVLLYVFAQNLEGYLLTPLVQDRAVKLPPAVTILVQVLMGLLMGGIGVVLAAPLAAAGMVILKRMYVEDVLGDKRKDASFAQGTETDRAGPNGA
jgi:predicted PurR-regulated permease PerM